MFKIGDKVRISVLDNIKGRVTAILETKYGFRFEVRYFWNCDAKHVYFYEDEIEIDAQTTK